MFDKINLSLYVIGYVIYNLAIHEMLGQKLYKTYSLSLISQRVLVVFFAISLYYIWGTDGIILGFALSFFPYVHRIVKIFRENKIDFNVLKPYKGFIANTSILDISRILTVYLDRIIILPLFGFATLGNYQLAMQFIAIASILPSSVYQFILPYESSGKKFDNLKKITIGLSVLLATAGIVLGPVLLPILFPQYVESIVMIQIMSFAIVPLTVNFMIISKFLANEKSRIVVTGSLIFIVTQVIGIVVIGSYFNVYGVAIAIVLASTTESIYLIIMNKVSKD